jgi:xanthine dehydrogenase iron-sulfur cluster and FAD-binding subunit A
LKLAKDAVGTQITTIEGLETEGRLHPLQQAFIDNAGSQCGFCSPAMIMSGAGLLLENPNPTPEQVRMAISGVVCRCGNYPHEVAAILAAARAGSGATGGAAAGEPAVLTRAAGQHKPYPRGETDPLVEIHRDAASKDLVALPYRSGDQPDVRRQNARISRNRRLEMWLRVSCASPACI